MQLFLSIIKNHFNIQDKPYFGENIKAVPTNTCGNVMKYFLVCLVLALPL